MMSVHLWSRTQSGAHRKDSMQSAGNPFPLCYVSCSCLIEACLVFLLGVTLFISVGNLARPYLAWQPYMYGKCVGATSIYPLAIPPVDEKQVGGDAGEYLAMATGQREASPPFKHRIAMPWMAGFLSRHLSLSATTSFFVIQMFCYGLIIMMLYFLGLQLGMNPFWSCVYSALFCLTYGGYYNALDIWLVGYAEYSLLMLGFICVLKNSFLFLAVVVAASCFFKETIAPHLIITFITRQFSSRAFFKGTILAAILSAVFVTIFLMIRWEYIFSPQASSRVYMTTFSLEHVWSMYKYWKGFYYAAANIIVVFGPLWVVAGTGWIIADLREKALSALIVTSILQIGLATDVARMVAISFPAIFYFVGIIFSRVNTAARVTFVFSSYIFFTCLVHNWMIKPALVGGTVANLLAIVCGMFQTTPRGRGDARK